MVRQAYMHRLALGRSGLVLASPEDTNQGSGDGNRNEASSVTQQYDERGYPRNETRRQLERAQRHASNAVLSTIGVCHNVYEAKKKRFPSLTEQTESLARADRARQWFRAGLLVLESASSAWLVGICYRLMTFRRYNGVPLSTVLWVESGFVSLSSAFITGLAYRALRMLVLPVVFTQSLRVGVNLTLRRDAVEEFMSSDVPLMQKFFLRHVPFGRKHVYLLIRDGSKLILDSAFIATSLAAIPLEICFILNCLSLTSDNSILSGLFPFEMWSNMWYLLKPQPLSTDPEELLTSLKSILSAPIVGLFFMQYFRATSYGFFSLYEHLQILRPESDQPNIIYIRDWKGPSGSNATTNPDGSRQFAPALAHSRTPLKEMVAEELRYVGFLYGKVESYFRNFFKRKTGSTNAVVQTTPQARDTIFARPIHPAEDMADVVRRPYAVLAGLDDESPRNLRPSTPSEADVPATGGTYHAFLGEDVIADENNRLRITAFADEPATWFIKHVYQSVDEVVMLPVLSYTLRTIAIRYADLQTRTSNIPLSWIGLRYGVIGPGAWFGGQPLAPWMSRTASVFEYTGKIVLVGGLICSSRFLFWEVYTRALCWAGPRYAHWGLEPVDDSESGDDSPSTPS